MRFYCDGLGTRTCGGLEQRRRPGAHARDGRRHARTLRREAGGGHLTSSKRGNASAGRYGSPCRCRT
ncbi:MAG: hypothetical protein MZV64_59665 [Ignavibacteriales bacterium]|nr:hypothetical protein [Ignavibacteriales bacterium]